MHLLICHTFPCKPTEQSCVCVLGEQWNPMNPGHLYGLIRITALKYRIRVNTPTASKNWTVVLLLLSLIESGKTNIDLCDNANEYFVNLLLQNLTSLNFTSHYSKLC